MCLQGDSGGGLVRLNDQGRYELVGLASWVVTFRGTAPEVYADVYFYKRWIEENI